MINGTLFYSISTTLNIWEVWKVIRDYKKREQINPLKCNLNVSKGINTYVQKSEFILEYQDPSKYPDSLQYVFKGKVRYKCLDVIDTPSQKCIYYHVYTDHMNFITSYSLRNACETSVLFVRISNIEVSNNFEYSLKLIQPTYLDEKPKLELKYDEKVDELNETIPLTQKTNPLTSDNKSIIHGPSETSTTGNAKSKLELKEKDKNEKQKNTHKSEKSIKVVEDTKEVMEINKIVDSIDIQIEKAKEEEKDKSNKAKSLKLHESKVFEVAKSILSFERGNMLSIIKAISKERNKTVQFQESKMIKGNYKTMANVIGDIKNLITIANNSSGFYINKDSDTPIYTIIGEKEVKSKENKINKCYTLSHNYLKKKMLLTFKNKQLNSYEAVVNYMIEWDIEQDFIYRIKRLSDEFCFVLLTVNIRGEDIESKIKKHKTDQYMRFILNEFEKQIHKFG